MHFGFEATGAHFLDFSEIQLEHDERPEDLYQRFMAFTEDSLLRSNSIQHHGALLTEDEELTPLCLRSSLRSGKFSNLYLMKSVPLKMLR